jgi:hypothetical protein
LFGPLLLIALGVVFLLSNLGALRGDTWETILRLWPILLILIGLDNLYQRQGIVGAIFAIGLGTVFLLANQGWINVNVWQLILRLWPLLLVAIGIDLVVGRRSFWASLVGLLALLALLAGALWLYGVRLETGQAVTGKVVGQSLGGISRAEIHLDSNVGDIAIRAGETADQLISGKVTEGHGSQVYQDYSVHGDQGTYTLRESGTYVVVGSGLGEEHTWDLSLTRTIPIAFYFNQGAGASEINLAGLQINGLNVNFGVGQTHVILPSTGNFNAKIDGAIGQIVIDVPKGVGVRIESGLALGNNSIPNSYHKADRVYTSPGYESSTNRMEIKVDLAIGNITVREIGN